MPSSYVPAFFIFLCLFFLSIKAQTSPCNNETFNFALNGRNMTHCKKLGALGAELGWNFDNIPRNAGKTVDILFGASLGGPQGWVAWGVNPFRPQMVGTRAFIALKYRNNSLHLDNYNVTEDTKHGCRFQPSPIDVKYENMHVEYSRETHFLTMFVTVTLPSDKYNAENLNHVWQVGSHLEDKEPKMHATSLQNFDSCEAINLTTGVGKGHHPRHVRKVHGALNIIGWGTLLPVGIIFPRYFKKFPFADQRWFRGHLTCQLLAFVIGTIGWALGISLGGASKNYTFKTHRIIGITIYSLATLQILALWLRPKQNDDYRKYWHIYHHFVGYALFSLIIVNIFQGISILRPAIIWKRVYVGILCFLGLIVLFLELCTWGKFIYETCIKKGKKQQTTP
ncbi:hypothetical protein AAC387_Pa12g2299 [Persea americana]